MPGIYNSFGSVSGDGELNRWLGAAAGGAGPMAAAPEGRAGPSRHFEGYFDPPSTASAQWLTTKWLGGLPGPWKAGPGAGPSMPQDGAEARRRRVLAAQEEDRERLKELLRTILGREPTPDEVLAAWEDGLDSMDAAARLGDDPKDPWHWLEIQANGVRAERESKGLNPDTGLPQPRTITDTHIRQSLTDPATARTLFDQMAYQAIGRKLSDEEKAGLVSALTAEEEANPQVTTTERDVNEFGETTETRTDVTGTPVDPGAFAEEQINEQYDGEVKDYWDDTTGTQVLMQLISGF